jgi:hypothetical protein
MLLRKVAVIFSLSATLLSTACATVNNTTEVKKNYAPSQTQPVVAQAKPVATKAIPNAICYDFVIKGMAGEWIKSLVVIKGADIGYKKAAQFLGDVDYISSEYDFEVYKGAKCTQLQKTYNPKSIFIYNK